MEHSEDQANTMNIQNCEGQEHNDYDSYNMFEDTFKKGNKFMIDAATEANCNIEEDSEM